MLFRLVMSRIEALYRIKSEIQNILDTDLIIELNDLSDDFKSKQNSINNRFKLHLTYMMHRLNKLDSANYKNYVIAPDEFINSNIAGLHSAYNLASKFYDSLVQLKSYRTENDIEIWISKMK